MFSGANTNVIVFGLIRPENPTHGLPQSRSEHDNHYIYAHYVHVPSCFKCTVTSFWQHTIGTFELGNFK